ncbi:hypothetical protein [uncultured Duncaniella sp.]|uniref:hypothetical protein n=1 Tax=uncultured Duncaniella sp. TaxID=2768039 RepID=UPI0025B62C60|nr:hypothetical protein [uncultured Duncaniella sp.]
MNSLATLRNVGQEDVFILLLAACFQQATVRVAVHKPDVIKILLGSEPVYNHPGTIA